MGRYTFIITVSPILTAKKWLELANNSELIYPRISVASPLEGCPRFLGFFTGTKLTVREDKASNIFLLSLNRECSWIQIISSVRQSCSNTVILGLRHSYSKTQNTCQYEIHSFWAFEVINFAYLLDGQLALWHVCRVIVNTIDITLLGPKLAPYLALHLGRKAENQEVGTSVRLTIVQHVKKFSFDIDRRANWFLAG